MEPNEALRDTLSGLHDEVEGLRKAVTELSDSLAYCRGELRALIGALADRHGLRSCACEREAA